MKTESLKTFGFTPMIAALAAIAIVTAFSMPAFAGPNANAKVAVHVIAHGSRTCAKNFPAILACDSIDYEYSGPDVDAFPVFFNMVEYQGFDYGMTWPGMYTCAFTSCSDLTIGTIQYVGDGVSHAWYTCQSSDIAVPGWGWIWDYGQVCIVPHPTAGGPVVGDCSDPAVKDTLRASNLFCAGIGGYAGDNPCVEPQPECEVSTTALDFGTVTTGQADTLSFTITNIGGGTLTGDVTETCDHYAVVEGGGAYSLTGGQSVMVKVEFAPTAAGTHNCDIETGTECDNVACTGVGELPPDCAVSTTTLDFGTVTIGDADTLSFTITNIGGGTLTGSVTESCAPFNIVEGGGAYNLTGGQSVTVKVRYSPTSAGSHNCTVQTGGACANVACSGVGELPPTCWVSADTLDYGVVAITETGTKNFTIKNVGGGTLTGEVSETCDHYLIIGGSGAYNLAANDSVVVQVQFAPQAVGTHTCEVQTGTECANVFCTGIGEEAPECQVSLTSIDFGTVTLGSSVDTTITITNIGGGTLTGGVSEACPDYQIISGSGAYSLGAGQFHDVVVRYEPQSVGTHNCTIETGAACANVACTGVGEPVPSCDVVPTALNFGTVIVGEADTLSFTITNSGGGTLTGDVTETCDHYAVVEGGGAYSLTGGQSVTVKVEFAPTAAGTHNCDIQTGTECTNVACTGAGEPAPSCDVVPTALNFGTVTTGETDTLSFTITNTGGGTLTGDVTETCDHYAIVEGGGAYSLTGGQSVTVKVEFAPTAAGTHNCDIQTGTECTNVGCTGAGELPPSCDVVPTALNFGTVTTGQADTLSFTLTNGGGGTLTGDVTETCDHYAIAEGGGAYSLTGGQSVTVKIEFAPTVAGTHNCDIQTGTECTNVACTGVGQEPTACDVDPTVLNFGTIIIGEADTLSFTITNTGGGTLSGSVTEACDHYAIVEGGGAYNLTEGQSVTVKVEFAPTASGTQNCDIQTGAECANVACTGVGQEPTACDVDQTALNFGTVIIGEADTLAFTITNTGGGTLTGDVTETCDHYAIVEGGGAYNLTEGQSVTVKVEFAPAAAGTHNCDIQTGTECANVACTGVGELAPACDVDQTALNFGTIPVGQADTLSFTITNTGGGTLTGDVTETCDHYAIVEGGGAYSLTGGQSVTVKVEFAPTVAGTHNCDIQTGAACANVACSATAEEVPPDCQVAPTSLDFGTVSIGTYANRSFTITNVGGGTLTGSVTEACDHYYIISGGGAYSLGSGQHVDVTVRFEPVAVGTHTCDIQTGAECVNVACTGVGEVTYLPLVLSKDDGLGGMPIDPGATFTYALHYENPNVVGVSNAVLTDELPPELIFVAAPGGTYAPGPHEVTWPIGTIGAGGSGDVTLEVQVDPATAPGSQIVNVAYITSDETGPTPTQAQETTQVSGGAITVYFDIKPGGCPNPLNPKSKGVLPVAILGTVDFDVTDIDPASVRLGRDGVTATVAPLRWAYEDVATPFDGDPCDCHELGPDGFEDMTLKFDTEAIVGTLDMNAVKGQTVVMTIAGDMMSGQPFTGEDCVKVHGRREPGPPGQGQGDELAFMTFEGTATGDELSGDDIGLAFKTPADGHVTLEIFDVHGRMVRMLIDQYMVSGIHTVTWNGRGGSGQKLRTGVYFARVRNANQSDTRKIVIVN